MADTWDTLPLSGSYPSVGETASTEPGCDDFELLAKSARGDERSFNVLYLRYHKPVYNYILRLIFDQEAAQDLLQEVFVGVWQGAGKFQGRSQVKNWIFRIAHNQVVSWLRRNRNTVSLDDAAESLLAELLLGDPDPEERAARAWESQRVAAALMRLAPKHRAVLELAFAHEMSYKDIAGVVGCPVGTVKSRMSYAMDQLAAILGPGEDD